MRYTGYEYIWFFFIYAFIGWLIEVVFAAFSRKRFANRGFLNGPLCPVYGCGMVFLQLFFGGLLQNLFFLFIGSFVTTSLLEYFTGKLMERFYGRKWWDYSDYKYNFGGYVCLQFSAVWAAGAVVLLKWVNPVFGKLIGMLPALLGRIILIVLAACFACDVLVTTGALLKLKRRSRRIEEIADGMGRLSGRMGGAITRLIAGRMAKAFPSLNEDGRIAMPVSKTKADKAAEGFACGVCFHKLVWLFFIGSFLGDVTETIFCFVTTGRLMSRSSVLYGPFSIVWGLGIVALTILLDRYRSKPDSFILLFGTVVGGAYEYVCSVFTELVFGTIFWDYSKIPFNLGGRINLLFCFFWGIASLVWIKLVYPFLSGLIEKLPKKFGTWASWIFVVFMVCNMAVSGLALARYSGRTAGSEPANAVERFLDEHYPDERMERIYPNAKITNPK